MNALIRLVSAAALLSCLSQADRGAGHVYHLLGQGTGHGGDWVTDSSVGYAGEYDQRFNEGYNKEENGGRSTSDGYDEGHGNDYASGHVVHAHTHGYGREEPYRLRGVRHTNQDGDGYGTDLAPGLALDGYGSNYGRDHGDDSHGNGRGKNYGKSHNDMYENNRYAEGFGYSHSTEYDDRYGKDVSHSHKTEYGKGYDHLNHHSNKRDNDYGVASGTGLYEGHVPVHQGHSGYSCGGYWKGVIGSYGIGHGHGDGYSGGHRHSHTHNGYSCGGYWKGIIAGYGKGHVPRSIASHSGDSGYGNTIGHGGIYGEEYGHSTGKVHDEVYDSEREGVVSNSFVTPYEQSHEAGGTYERNGTSSRGHGHVRGPGNGVGYAPGLRHGSRAVYGYVHGRGNGYTIKTRHENVTDRRHERIRHSDIGYGFGKRRRNGNVIGYAVGHRSRQV